MECHKYQGEILWKGAAGTLHIGEPELYVDNQSRKRSGHMSHAMVEYAPGKILAFNSNCSAVRLGGHAAFGFLECRRSEDGGRTWSEPFVPEWSMKALLDGIYTFSAEKAVAVNGVITVFLLRNTQKREICCEPWLTPMYIRSFDGGATWTEPMEFSKYPGRIYDAQTFNGAIYVLEFCNEWFFSETAEMAAARKAGTYNTWSEDICYRLFRSDDAGETFSEAGIPDLDSKGYAYGNLQFRPDGSLLVYSCCIHDGFNMGMALSSDFGKTWTRLPVCRLDKGIRNVQVSRLGGGYVMHGRAFLDSSWGKGFVMYTSADGIAWDEGILLESEKLACYYSNNLLLKDEDGKERLLVQYSDSYDGARVNVMHRILTLE